MQVEKKCSEHNIPDCDSSVLCNKVELLPKLIENLKNIAKREGYKSCKIIPEQLFTGGGSYLGDLFLVDIKGETDDGEKETHIFVKQIIPNERNKFLSIPEVYVRELFVYKELCNIFTKLQEDAGVPKEKMFKMAKCYNECNIESIILENVVKSGFETLYKMDVMPLSFAQLSVTELAKFHSLSLVIKHKMPIFFYDRLFPIKYSLNLNKDWELFTDNMFKMTLELLEGDPCLERLEVYMKTTLEKFKRFMKETTSPGCCLCHGDYRVNNILAKLSEGEVIDIVPVDFQLVHYGNPVQDFLYLIFLNSDQDFRRKHLTDLKDLYFDSLKEFLTYFNLDVETVYPKRIFEKDYKERMDYGLLMPLSVLPLLFTPDDDVIDLGASDVKCNSIDPKFKDRIRGIIYDFMDWGYL